MAGSEPEPPSRVGGDPAIVADSRRCHSQSDQSGPEEGRDQPLPAVYSRTTRAGAPATTQWLGTLPRTTAPAATTTFRPMLAPGRTTAPAPSQQPGPIDTAALLGHWRPIGTSGSA